MITRTRKIFTSPPLSRWFYSRRAAGSFVNNGSLYSSTRSVSTIESPGLPASVSRVGQADVFPNEYPGQIYAFNWALNGDGVTPVNESAFRITKPLDLKVAGLEQPKTNPIKITPAPSESVPEAGNADEEDDNAKPILSFEDFDAKAQLTKDSLSMSPHLYCPEGYAPSTRTTVRVITNSATLAPTMLAYLDRAPKRDPPKSTHSITVYAYEEKKDDDFSAFAIEEVEEVDGDTGETVEPRSVSSVVVCSRNFSPKSGSLNKIVSAIEQSVLSLEADAKEREEERENQETEAASG